MRIKFLKDAFYPQVDKYGKPDPVRTKAYKAGEIYDLPADHANRWIRRNAAEEVAGDDGKKPAQKLVPNDAAKV